MTDFMMTVKRFLLGSLSLKGSNVKLDQIYQKNRSLS